LWVEQDGVKVSALRQERRHHHRRCFFREGLAADMESMRRGRHKQCNLLNNRVP
jgi:hypothetical protein